MRRNAFAVDSRREKNVWCNSMLDHFVLYLIFRFSFFSLLSDKKWDSNFQLEAIRMQSTRECIRIPRAIGAARDFEIWNRVNVFCFRKVQNLQHVRAFQLSVSVSVWAVESSIDHLRLIQQTAAQNKNNFFFDFSYTCFRARIVLHWPFKNPLTSHNSNRDRSRLRTNWRWREEKEFSLFPQSRIIKLQYFNEIYCLLSLEEITWCISLPAKCIVVSGDRHRRVECALSRLDLDSSQRCWELLAEANSTMFQMLSN